MVCTRVSMKPSQFSIFYEETITIGFTINNTLDDFSQDDDPANKLWHIVKYYNNEDLQEEGIQLKQGDVIKLGRIRFKVKEIHKGIFQLKNNFDEGNQLNFVSTDGRSNNKIQIGVPQINNYIKQSTLIKQSESASAK